VGAGAVIGRPRPTSAEPEHLGWVCFAAQDWWYHSQAHSEFQLMRHLSLDRPVLVVNSIGMRMPLPKRSAQPFRRVGRKIRSVARLIRAPLPENPHFRVMSPMVLPFYGSRWLRALNARLIAAQVRMACAFLGIVRPVYFVTIPTAEPVLDFLPPGQVIFNRADKLSLFEEADGSYISDLEARLLQRSEHVVFASHALMDAERPAVGDRGHFIGHGVDLDHFAARGKEEEPEDLRSIPHPRVGFFGTLDELVDFDLIRRVALEIRHAQIVLVGPVRCSIGGLGELPNVHVLGFRSYDLIPTYGSGFDVAIMPWAQREWIQWCNPIKLKEYLALGLPVVSTPFPEVDWYRDVVQVGRTEDEFVACVRRALVSPGSCTERRQKVAGDSWASIAISVALLMSRPSDVHTPGAIRSAVPVDGALAGSGGA